MRVCTRTLLRSTPPHFLLTAELGAWQGERRVFSKNWHEEIPRDLL